ncbi:unnamed protein product [Symbiodinium necroappetens]|uniref:Uncharacterized protein n=1 Tax=Symbiodinium necroappetens TaxID=1628268 RepID=A0A813BPR2_9DINO|nr:unnamed protein product [Symbiodinium necroappetens]
MPPSHEPKPSQSPVPPSHEPEPSQSTVPPSQPEPANTVNTQDCYFYYLPLLYTCYRIELDGLGFLLSLYNIDSSLFLSLVTSLSQDLQPSLIAASGGNLVSTGELVPFSSGVAPAAKPGKGKGGTLPDGKGNGTGAGPPSGHHEHAPNMVWAQGPDEAPMLAVEMEFDDEDSSAPEPPKELPDISEGAIYKRMWRLFRPRADGSYLVPECVVHEYQNKETRPGVVRAFERCGYDVAKFVKKVKKTVEDEEEVAINEDWEFLTEEEMPNCKSHCYRKTHRSLVARMVEAEEEGTIEDQDLVMDWSRMDMQGADSSLPAQSQNGSISLEGLDKKILQCFPDLEKVPASSIAKNVRAARTEGHDALGAKFSRAMAEGNASRDVHDMLSTFNLGLRVPRESITFIAGTGEKPIHLPWIRPSQWVAYLVGKCPALMFGTSKQIPQQLEGFWESYRESHPGHQVFSFSSSRLRRTIPLLLHGDEGRYLKRSNYLIMTVESCLGSVPQPKQSCSCKDDPVLSRYTDLDVEPNPKRTRASMQHCNSRGHPYLSKFLCCGMASSEYKEHPDLMFEAFRLIAEDLEVLCTDGVEIPGHGCYYGGFLGLKGDMAFHHKLGHLLRSYRNLGRDQDIPMCHLCLAGSENVPFESVEDTPPWHETYCVSDPWPEDDPPDIANIPFDPLCRPAMFRLDVFHLWKVGLGRDLVGSGVVVLCLLGYFDFQDDCTKNLDDRLARAHSCFRLWCLGSHCTAALRSFTRLNFNCKTLDFFPWANVKGSDCTLLSKWLLFFLRAQVKPKQTHRRLLRALQDTLQSSITFFTILHSHGLWLPRHCAQRAQHALSTTIRGFMYCAISAKTMQIRAFGLKPKFHSLHHVSKDMLEALRGGAERVISPLAYSCESNEDMVGKISRLARKVSARLVNKRVYDRLMFKTKVLLRRAGFLKRQRKPSKPQP